MSLADALARHIEQQERASKKRRAEQVREPLWTAVADTLALWRRTATQNPNPKESPRG
ncbi:hypothetical protein [Streptomyces sp. NPDC059906]|uniref:hypothetical protein n=1 Tax=Streptomyces sp. NPDC059906 TaxID=3346997 RepID=UPI00364F7CBB